MLASMLPMNLFGQTFGGVTFSGTLQGRIAFLPGQFDGDRLVTSTELHPDPIGVHIPLNALARLQSPIQLTFNNANSWIPTWSGAGTGPTNLQATITTQGSVGVQPQLSTVGGGFTMNPNQGNTTNWNSWGTTVTTVTIPPLYLDANGLVASGQTGVTLNLSVPVRPFHDDNVADFWRNATMGIVAVGDEGRQAAPGHLQHRGPQILAQAQQINVGANVARTVNWSVTGGARGFTSALLVPPIRLSESMFGTIEGDLVLRLTAPQFYRWSFVPRNVGGVLPAVQENLQQDRGMFGRLGITDSRQMAIYAGGPQASRGNSFSDFIAANGTRPAASIANGMLVGGTEHGGTEVQVHDRQANRRMPINRIVTGFYYPSGIAAGHATGRHRMDIHLLGLERNHGFAGNAEWLEIRNLWLVPDDHAATTGDVAIDVAVGRSQAGWMNQGAANFNYQIFVNPNPGTAITPPINWEVAPGQDATALNVMIRQNVATGTVTTWAVTESLVRLGVRVADQNVLAAGQTATLTVGTRGGSDLMVDVVDGPRDMRTGYLGNNGNPRAANANFGEASTNNGARPAFIRNRGNEGLPFFEGVMTSTLIIEENVAGAFGFGFGSPINFEFLDEDGNQHPGIRILGMEARAGNVQGWGWSRGEFNNFYGGPTAIAFEALYGRRASYNVIPGNRATSPELNANQNWMNFRGWVSAQDQRVPSIANVGRVNENGATLYLPSQTIYDVAAPGMLEVRFWLSLEAGYEWKYGPNIDVTISGTGVANLVGTGGSYTTTIGHARDPIQMSLATGSTGVETGTMYNIQGGVQEVSDVIIDVLDNGAFPVGAEIWVYVGTDTIGRNFDINLVNIPTVTVNAESGLRLDNGRLMHPGAAGHVGRAGVAFTVTRQPYGGNAPAPEITISNLNVEGQAFPGIEYQVIVSGTHVAMNDQEVWHARYDIGQAGVAHHLARLNRGIFTSLPYNETIIENLAGGVWEHAPAPELAPGFATATGEFRMWAGMGPIAGVDEPFRWVDLAGTNLRVGFVSARAFAYFVNGNPDVGVDWNAATSTATLQGQDVHGNAVQVVMTVGSNIAQVNGTPVDIATFAGQSGPASSIQVVPTPDGRIFLPLRFLANAFGRTVHADGEVVVFR